MTTIRSPQLITPPKEEEEIYPYRRAWRSVFIETGILTILLLVFFVLFNLLGITVPQRLLLPFNLLIVLLPTLLWLVFSRVPERLVVEPRRRLLTTFVVTALVANAIGIPLLDNVLQPNDWLPLASTLNRIMGYTTTVAILQEFLKYLVIRYIVWPEYYRVRTDAIAYGAASGVAYAMVISLNYLFQNPMATPDAIMLRVFATTTLNIVGSVIVAYGLAESQFSNALSFLLPITVLLAAIVNGIAIAMRPTFMKATLGLTISAEKTIFGVIFALILYIVPIVTLLFLFNVSERREQDKLAGQDI
ncbi:MAG: PrsW family glutamic-type intramembrane protease [Anaerolineae bacterium]|nr:PrsW family glutamic-type intramembrane protease [Anaerolineae bacterium]